MKRIIFRRISLFLLEPIMTTHTRTHTNIYIYIYKGWCVVGFGVDEESGARTKGKAVLPFEYLTLYFGYFISPPCCLVVALPKED